LRLVDMLFEVTEGIHIACIDDKGVEDPKAAHCTLELLGFTDVLQLLDFAGHRNDFMYTVFQIVWQQ